MSGISPRKWSVYILTSLLIFTLVSVTIAMLFGLVDQNTNIGEESAKLTGDRAGGLFKIMNSDGDYGVVDTTDLESRIDDCRLETPGFRNGEKLKIAVGEEVCIPENKSKIKLPVFFKGDYFNLTVAESMEDDSQ